jgi:D-alanyl-D-alanine carboxypeptidase
MKNGIVTVLAGAVTAVLATSASSAEPTQVERVQATLDAWLAARAPIEKVTGIAAYIKVTGIAAYIKFGAAGTRDRDLRWEARP